MRRSLNLPDEFTQSASRWWGHGASFAGLSGPVYFEPFVRALGGSLHNPRTGKREQIPLSQGTGLRYRHREGWDLTLSPPKSVSVAFLVGCDRAVLTAHESAVKAALGIAEAHLATGRRTRDGRCLRVQMNNLLVAMFRHSTNRDAEPQLHTHCIVANAIFDESHGCWRALEPKPLLRYQRMLDRVYLDSLADGLRAAGYRIEDAGHGPEIVGIGVRARRVFSGRSATIREHQLARAATKGWNPGNLTYHQRKASTLATRAAKRPVPLPVLREFWRFVADRQGLGVDAIVRDAVARRTEGTRAC